MSPPLPPSPPDGPPRGTYFSLRNAIQPLPPSPPFTRIVASSTNIDSHREKISPKDTLRRIGKTKSQDARELSRLSQQLGGHTDLFRASKAEAGTACQPQKDLKPV